MSENMKKIQKIALSRLLKLEVRDLVEDLVKIVDKHNPEALHLQNIYDYLLAQESKVKYLEVAYGKHQLTKTLYELHEKRLQLASTITTQIRTITTANLDFNRRWLEKASPTVNDHLLYLRSNNRVIINSIIRAFLQHLNEKPDELTALTSLGLKIYIDALKETNDKYHKVYTQRRGSISKRPKIDYRAIERDALNVVQILFDQINYFQSEYKELNYEMLINEINVLLSEFSFLIKTRATTNKKKKEKAKKIAETEANKKLLQKGLVIDPDKSIESKAKIEITEHESVTKQHPSSDNLRKTEDAPIHNSMKVLKSRKDDKA